MDIYVVQIGDTIHSISETFGISVEKLIIDNGLEAPYQLIPGQAVVILYPRQTYIVQEGDTLGDIAASFNISVNEILRNNPILFDSEFIYPGQVLYISFDRTAKLTTYGYTNTFIDRHILIKTLPYLTYLSIFNYIIDENASAIGSDNDLDIIQLAIDNGVIPLLHLATLTVQGEFDLELTNEVISNEEFQNRLFENVIQILKDKGYYGIVLSAQHINSENQSLFYNYTKRFSERLRQEGYLIFIAIDPRITTTTTDIILKDIDYSAFTNIVDSIIIMQYIWGIEDAPPAPLISVPNVNIFLDYALPQVGQDKMAIGIPIFGLIWELPYVSDVSNINTLTIESVMNLAMDTGATIQFDEVSQTPFFQSYSFSPSQFIVWFINPITINSLLTLLTERNISAIGLWNIVEFYPPIWLVINSQYEIIKLLPEP